MEEAEYCQDKINGLGVRRIGIGKAIDRADEDAIQNRANKKKNTIVEAKQITWILWEMPQQNHLSLFIAEHRLF